MISLRPFHSLPQDFTRFGQDPLRHAIVFDLLNFRTYISIYIYDTTNFYLGSQSYLDRYFIDITLRLSFPSDQSEKHHRQFLCTLKGYLAWQMHAHT